MAPLNHLCNCTTFGCSGQLISYNVYHMHQWQDKSSAHTQSPTISVPPPASPSNQPPVNDAPSPDPGPTMDQIVDQVSELNLSGIMADKATALFEELYRLDNEIWTHVRMCDNLTRMELSGPRPVLASLASTHNALETEELWLSSTLRRLKTTHTSDDTANTLLKDSMVQRVSEQQTRLIDWKKEVETLGTVIPTWEGPIVDTGKQNSAQYMCDPLIKALNCGRYLLQSSA